MTDLLNTVPRGACLTKGGRILRKGGGDEEFDLFCNRLDAGQNAERESLPHILFSMRDTSSYNKKYLSVECSR